MPAKKKPKSPKSIKTLTHAEEQRRNIPTAEYPSMVKSASDLEDFSPER